MADITAPIEPPPAGAADDGGVADERIQEVGLIRRLLVRPEIGALIGAVAVWLFFLFFDGKFIQIIGAARFTDQAATLGVMAVFVALLMIGGEFDLSAGVMIGSTGLLLGYVTDPNDGLGWSITTGLVITLAFALSVGFLNGILVTRTKLPSFIITLGTFFALRGANVGITRIITDETRVTGVDDAPDYDFWFDVFSRQVTIAGERFQIQVFWWIGLTIVGTWILMRTKAGNWIFASGGDANAARNMGVPANATKIGLFMGTAFAAWLVGMMRTLESRGMTASGGVGEEFEFIIAAVIGGCLLTGGYGSVIGAALGALIFGMTRTGITFAGWDSEWFFSFLGGMLLFSVFLNNYVRHRAERMGR
jgi:simple sugar transport system permease protein